METLSLLEQKVVGLIEVIKELKARNVTLEKERDELAQKVEKLEHAVLHSSKDLEHLHEEKQTAKQTVDELLASIEHVLTLQENPS